MNIEIWKFIPNYEDYQVSNFGRVKSLKYGKEKILKESDNSHGYKMVILRNKKESKNYKIHKLVAICFLNHTPDGFNITIDHIDNNKLNNHVSNLQLIPNRLNASKACKNKTSKYIGVSWCKASKKWRAQYRFNGKPKALGRFNSELEALNVYENAINKLRNNF